MTQQRPEIHIVDNDFLIKLARWDLLDDFLQVVNTTTRQIRVINSLRARTGIAVGKPNLKLLGTAAAAKRLEHFLLYTATPTPIDNDFMAAGAGVQDLDVGELTLLAALCAGAGDYFYTGDKRAIRALATFVGTPFEQKLRGRIICLDQVIYRIIHDRGIGTLRENIAADPAADAGIANMLVGGAQTPSDALKMSLRSECSQLHAGSGKLLVSYPV